MAYIPKKGKKKSTALAVRDEKLPAHIQNLGAEGTDDLTAEGVMVPYIKLAHKNNKSLGLTEGDIYSSVSGENFGPEVEFAVLDALPDVWKKFDDEGKLLGVSNNGKTWEYGDLKGEELEEEEDWRLLHKCFYILLTSDAQEGKALPYMLSFSKTAKPNAKKLKNLLVQETKLKKAAIFSVPFMLTSEEKSNTSREWLVFDVSKSDRKWLTKEEVLLAQQMRAEIVKRANFIETEEKSEEEVEEKKSKKSRKSKY